MKRTKLSNRQLPNYSRGEEIMNMVTHIVGGGLGVIAFSLCLIKAILKSDPIGGIGAGIYGVTMIALYTVSSVYHGLRTQTSKKVMQIIDHCSIYFLIAGTYTPIALSALLPIYPALGTGLLAAEWLLAITAGTLTAFDLKKYNIFSMICYIGMGWGIIFFIPQALVALSAPGFALILAGGIVYTVGAILYGIGSKIHWIHSVFHIFVVLGSFLQFLGIFLYVI